AWGVVDRIDGDGDGSGVRVEAAVVGLEGEAGRAVRAVVVGVRGVAVGSGRGVGDRHRAVRVRGAHQAVGERVAVGIGGGRRARGRGVFVRRQRAGLSNRGAVEGVTFSREAAVAAARAAQGDGVDVDDGVIVRQVQADGVAAGPTEGAGVHGHGVLR